MTYPRPALALALLTSLSGCFFDDCNRCGRCASGATSFAAADVDPGLSLPAAVVWAEPDGEVVVEVSLSQFVTCEQTRTESLFFRWNPNTRRLEAREQGPSAQAARRTPTTTGGGVRSYEDALPGLTLQVADLYAEGRIEISTRLDSVVVRMTCRGGYGVALVCQ